MDTSTNTTLSPFMSYGGYRDDIGSICIDNIGALIIVIVIFVILYCNYTRLYKNIRHKTHGGFNLSSCKSNSRIKPTMRNMNWLYNNSIPQ